MTPGGLLQCPSCPCRRIWLLPQGLVFPTQWLGVMTCAALSLGRELSPILSLPLGAGNCPRPSPWSEELFQDPPRLLHWSSLASGAQTGRWVWRTWAGPSVLIKVTPTPAFICFTSQVVQRNLFLGPPETPRTLFSLSLPIHTLARAISCPQRRGARGQNPSRGIYKI